MRIFLIIGALLTLLFVEAALGTPPAAIGTPFCAVNGTPQASGFCVAPAAEKQTVTDVIVIDSAVADRHLFYPPTRVGMDVIEIDSTRDGLDQLVAALASYRQLDALHIVSHASAGKIQLGNSIIDQATLKKRVSELRRLGDALAVGADILLYGCDVAQGDEGDAFLKFLAGETKRDVAASTNLTGGKQSGGDWALEVTLGKITTGLPFDSKSLADFDGVLQMDLPDGQIIDMSGFNGQSGYTVSYDVTGLGNILYLRGFDGVVNFTCDDRGCTADLGDNDGKCKLPGPLEELRDTAVQIDLGAHLDNRFNIDWIEFSYTDAELAEDSSFDIETNDFGALGSTGWGKETQYDIPGAYRFELPNKTVHGVRLSPCETGWGSKVVVSRMKISNAAPDFRPPSVSVAVSEVTTMSANFATTSSEPGMGHYVLLTKGSGAPTSTQVKDGKDGAGDSAPSSGSFQIATADTSIETALLGLDSGTEYDVYVAVEDEVPNLATTPIRQGFTTISTGGNLVSATGVAEPVALPFSADSQPDTVNLFDFALIDGVGDGRPTEVSQLVLQASGSSASIERQSVTWLLSGAGAVDVLGVYDVTAQTLTFDVGSVSIADGATQVFTVGGYYNSTAALIDGHTFVLTINGSEDVTLDASGSQMGTTPSVSNGSGSVIEDDAKPNITSITLPPNDAYVAGGVMDFILNYDETVVVDTTSGAPRAALALDSANRFANYISGSGSAALLFRYVVQVGDSDVDGITLGTHIDLNASTIMSSFNIEADHDLTPVGDLSGVLVDARAPVVGNNQKMTVNEGQVGAVVASTDLSAADNLSESNAVRYRMVSTPSHGAWNKGDNALAVNDTFTQSDIDAGSITYSHDGSETTSDTWRFEVSDGVGNVNANGGNDFVFSIDVSPINEPPVAADDSVTIGAGAPVSIDVAANDTDPDIGDSVAADTVTLASMPANGTAIFDAATGDVMYTSNVGFTGTDTFTYTIADTSGAVSNTASVAVDVQALPAFGKFFSPSTVLEGQPTTLTYTIDATTTTVDVSNLAFADQLPPPLLIGTAPNAITTCEGRLTASAGATMISLEDGEVAAGQSCTIAVDVMSGSAGALTSESGALTTSLGMGATASATLQVNGPPLFSAKFNPTPVSEGVVSTLTFHIDNSAGTADAENLALTAVLPMPLIVSTPANATTTCEGGALAADPAGTPLSYTQGALVAGASCTVSVDVRGSSEGSYVLTSGALHSSLGASGSAQAQLAVIGAPDLTISVTNGKDHVSVNALVDYLVSVDNEGNEDVSSNTVSVPLPDGLMDVTWECEPIGVGADCGHSGAGAISDIVDLPSGTKVNYLFTGTVNLDVNELLTVAASVSTPEGVIDRNVSNNSDTDTDAVRSIVFESGFEAIDILTLNSGVGKADIAIPRLGNKMALLPTRLLAVRDELTGKLILLADIKKLEGQLYLRITERDSEGAWLTGYWEPVPNELPLTIEWE